MNKNVLTCPICGTGILEDCKNGEYVCSHCAVTVVDCPVCNGKGYYQAGWRGTSETDFENCLHCHGTGFVMKKDEN